MGSPFKRTSLAGVFRLALARAKHKQVNLLAMTVTSRAPNVPVKEFKRTKILATIGPSTDSYEQILTLLKAGANGLRLNFSHGTYEERERQIKWIRKAEKEYGKPVAIVQDLQGPKMRLGDFDGIVTVQVGQQLTLKYEAKYEIEGHLPTQYDLSHKVQRGERLLLNDGTVKTEVTNVKDGVIHVRAQTEGILTKRKGINLPDTNFEGDIITDKDKEDLAWGSSHDIDYVALSFVQTSTDVHHLRRLIDNLRSDAKIIAKIETGSAVEHIESIVEATDAVMIARGDLAIETSPEAVPVTQRKIIGLGLQYAKPTIVATQMLATMTQTPEPTRAEVSDVATAIIVGADALMLSDETASGKYPIEAVSVMKRVIRYTQENSPLRAIFSDDIANKTRQRAICEAVIDLADSIKATAIVAETSSGNTALQISSLRPIRPIIAVTGKARVAQQLALVYGVKTYVRPVSKLAATRLTNWLQQQKVLSKGDMIVTASGKHPGVVGTTDTIKVRVLE